jgi:hypothetical protein
MLFAIPLCRWPFPRLCGFPSCRVAPATVKQPVRPLFGFRLPSEFCLTQPSSQAAARELLSWALVPFSTPRTRRFTSYGLYGARYVPPSGFGYPHGGFLPPSPCRLFFTPAALLGFALRSFLRPEGIRRVSAGKNPPAVSPTGFPVPPKRDRPAQWAAASGLRPFRESLATAAGLVRKPLVAPLGFTLLGSSGENLSGLSPGFLPRTSRPSASRPTTACASEYRSALAWPHPSARFNERCGRDNPYRVSAPVRPWAFERARAGAILFAFCRFVHRCRPRQS